MYQLSAASLPAAWRWARYSASVTLHLLYEHRWRINALASDVKHNGGSRRWRRSRRWWFSRRWFSRRRLPWRRFSRPWAWLRLRVGRLRWTGLLFWLSLGLPVLLSSLRSQARRPELWPQYSQDPNCNCLASLPPLSFARSTFPTWATRCAWAGKTSRPSQLTPLSCA